MSAAKDKERRFVEDQRRIAARPMSGGTCVRTAETVELERQDAILAEAAKVLREMPFVLNPSIAVWWETKAQPLLDKLGERESEGVRSSASKRSRGV